MSNSGVTSKEYAERCKVLEVGISDRVGVGGVLEHKDDDAVEPLPGYQSGLDYCGKAHQNGASQEEPAEINRRRALSCHGTKLWLFKLAWDYRIRSNLLCSLAMRK